MSHWTEELFVDAPELFVEEFEQRLDRADEEVRNVLDLVGETYGLEPDRVLDVPCGVGRHAIPFAETGLTVDGADISPAFLDRARARAAEAGIADRTTFHELDMREVASMEGRYDLAINLWTSIGYYDEAADRRFLEGVRERLEPGGAIVLELANKEGVLANYERGAVIAEGEGQVVAERREYDPRTSRMHSTRWVVDEDDDRFRGRYEVDLRCYAPVELSSLLEAAGFEGVRLYESLEGEDLHRDSTRLVALGAAPAEAEE